MAKTWFDKRKRKSRIALVNVKQKLILCLWEKNTEICKGCESGSMKTSASKHRHA